MTIKYASLLLICFAFACVTSTTYPTISVNTLKKVFDGVKPYSDVSNAFYSVKGLQLLGETLQDSAHAELCNFLKTKSDKTNVESIYYAVSLAGLLKSCTLTPADYQAALSAASSSQSVTDLYYYSLVSQALKLPVDSKKVTKNLIDGLKADSSILNQAYSLHIGSLLTGDEEAKKLYDTIEDILDQADELDKKYLQYEGGVGTTSLVLEGIFLLAERVKSFPAKFDQTRLSKFVNYLTSKRFPINIKSAFFLLRISQKLSNNKFKVPVILNRLSQVGVSTVQTNLLIGLSDLLGQTLNQQFNVEAESAKSPKPNGPVLLSSKKKFTSKASDGSTFELRLVEQNQQPEAAFYVVRVSAATQDARFFLVNPDVEVKVTTSVSLVDVQAGVADRDQTAPKLQNVAETSPLKLEGDQQSKFFLKFSIKDKVKGALREAHQTFVRFTQVKSGRDIIFLAQAASSQANLYSAEIDFASNAKNFLHQSGAYTVELVVSDPLFENGIRLKLAEIKLLFVDDQSQSGLQDKAKLYAPLPEIKHIFRLPEQTPPAIVSTVFTGLCLFPLLLLVVLWFGIGFNFSKFSFSLSALLFHVSLAAIFGLFFCYWIKLNMFQTLRYLLLIGGVALFSGNALLKNLFRSTNK